ncbi:hypothetical protein BDW66DRAFT_128834 [Aspergillus desertorum]
MPPTAVHLKYIFLNIYSVLWSSLSLVASVTRCLQLSLGSRQPFCKSTGDVRRADIFQGQNPRPG